MLFFYKKWKKDQEMEDVVLKKCHINVSDSSSLMDDLFKWV